MTERSSIISLLTIILLMGVELALAAPQPDLIPAKDINITHGIIGFKCVKTEQGGMELRIALGIGNQGTAPTTVDVKTQAKVTDQGASLTLTQNPQTTTKGLNANSWVKLKLMTAAAKSGHAYKLSVKVDLGNAQPESNETNNVAKAETKCP